MQSCPRSAPLPALQTPMVIRLPCPSMSTPACPAAACTTVPKTPSGAAEAPVVLLSSDDEELAQLARLDADGSPLLDQDAASEPATADGGPRMSARLSDDSGTANLLQRCVAVYPPGLPNGVEVRGTDLARLEDGAFLNDTVIDLYIRYIQEHLPEDIRNRCHFCNSFFFKKLTEKRHGQKSGDSSSGGGAADGKDSLHKQGFEHVRTWTKGVDIFSKDWLFVPIHGNLHWSLVLIAHPGVPQGSDTERERCIIHLDSLQGGRHAKLGVARTMRRYLQNEWERLAVEGPEDCAPKQWATAHPGVPHPSYATLEGCPDMAAPGLPQQDNGWDCGLFLLTTLEFFVFSPPEALTAAAVRDSRLAEANQFRGFMSEAWYSKRNAGALRGLLRSVILQLFATQGEEKAEALGKEGKGHTAVLVAAGAAAASEALQGHQERIQDGGQGYVPPEAYQPGAARAYDRLLQTQVRAAGGREKRKR